MKELTTEERLQVFILCNAAKVLHKGEVWHIASISILNQTVFIRSDNKFLGVSPCDCQLILKSLEEITEEDKREVFRLILHFPYAEDIKVRFLNFSSAREGQPKTREIELSFFDPFDGGITGTARSYKYVELPYWVADFLRSKNYALPFKGADLFASGIAVKSPERSEDL